MRKKENTPDKNCTHLAGEYFVAAELCKRGYAVGITMGNAKAIDILAEKGAKTVNIQAKAIRTRRQVGWPTMKYKILPNITYVLACLNEVGTAPTYFVLTAREAKGRIRQYSTAGIIRYNEVDSPRYRGRWDKIEKALSSG